MRNFEIDSSEMLTPQDWTFPIPISYGPGTLSRIGKFCESLKIKNPLIVTDRGSKELPFIEKLKKFLIEANIGSDKRGPNDERPSNDGQDLRKNPR